LDLVLLRAFVPDLVVPPLRPRIASGQSRNDWPVFESFKRNVDATMMSDDLTLSFAHVRLVVL
jgi:hypothetical protein